MSTVREHLGLLWLSRRALMTSRPEDDSAWAAQAAFFVSAHLNDLIELAGGADIEEWVRKKGVEIPADFPCAATKAAAPADAPTVAVPLEAYLWLMGLGRDGFIEDRDGAFWWRGAFNDRAGLDMIDIYQASKDRAPVEDAREQQQGEGG